MSGARGKLRKKRRLPRTGKLLAYELSSKPSTGFHRSGDQGDQFYAVKLYPRWYDIVMSPRVFRNEED